MARQAEFIINGTSVMAELKKVDRKKIYGWSTVDVFDENIQRMEQISSKFEVNLVEKNAIDFIKYLKSISLPIKLLRLYSRWHVWWGSHTSCYKEIIWLN